MEAESEADKALTARGEASSNGAASGAAKEERRGGRGFGPAARSGGGNGVANGGTDPRAAVAAKISAARRLARRLSEEKVHRVLLRRVIADMHMHLVTSHSLWGSSLSRAQLWLSRDEARAISSAWGCTVSSTCRHAFIAGGSGGGSEAGGRRGGG